MHRIIIALLTSLCVVSSSAAQDQKLVEAEAKLAETIRARSKSDKPGIIGEFNIFRKGDYGIAGAMSADGSKIAVHYQMLDKTNKRTVGIHDLATDKEICRFDEPERTRKSAFSPDGSTLVLGDEKNITFWDAQTGKKTNSFPVQDLIWALQYTPDGKGLLVGLHAKAMILDPASGKVLREFKSKGEEVWYPVISPDGSIVAAGLQSFSSKAIASWNANGELIRRVPIKDISSCPRNLQFTSDSKQLCFDGYQGGDKLLVWDLKGEPRELTPNKGVLDRVVSPDGKLAVFDKSQELVVVDVATGKEKRTKSRHVIGGIRFFPGGTLLATCTNGTFVVWDVKAIRP